MLKLILGRAGSGKTHRVREQLAQAVNGGYERVYLLVPEQFSFESERALYRELGAQKSLAVEVVSFTRLANLVFRAYGGLAKSYIDDCARRMLMSAALGELKDQLSVYQRHHAAPAFVTSMLGAVEEFKNAGVTPEALAAAGQNAQSGALCAKTDELSLIYGAYEALLARGYADPLDDLPAANRLLGEHDLFAGAAVFVDEFKGFTAVELETLSCIIRGARDCTVALCADGLADAHHGMGLFSPVISIANRLVRLAKEGGVPVASPEVLTVPHRFANDELCAVERGIFDFSPAICDKNPDGVRVFSAAGPYEELELVAAEIVRLVREKGLRYRDIVVIARDVTAYKTALESVLPRYGIPYFFDFTQTIERTPVIAYTLYAVECAASYFNSDSLLALLKTGLAGLDALDIALLENYVYIWDIKGGAWRAEFSNHPRGFADELTDGDRAQLERLNALRERVITPLARLADAIKSANGEGFARAVYDYLCETGARTEAAAQIERARQNGRHNEAQEAERVWEILIGILDAFALVLGGTELAAKRALELLRLAANAYDMGSIPQTLDQVLVGSAERIRASIPKAAFVIGANEGVFPLVPQGGGLFTDSEREALIAQGLALAKTQEQKAVEERFIAYKALTCASASLTVSYPRAGVRGEVLHPSVIVRRLAQIFPRLAPCDASSLTEEATITNEQTALAAAARHMGEDTPLAATLRTLLEGNDASPRYDAVMRAAHRQRFSVDDGQTSRRLFGENLTLSPTGLETYYRCRFSYFLRYGIRLKKREKARLSPLEAGSLIHYALQELLSRYTIQALAKMSVSALLGEIDAVLEQYLLAHMGGKEDKPARFAYLYNRLAATVARLVGQLVAEFSQSDFTPDAFELSIERGGEVEPVELVTPTGARVMVQGKIDRVDVMTKNGRRYVRVVDYKSGKKSFNLSDVYYGLNMQMLLYLFTVCQNGRYEGGVPAGVLYMPAQNPVADVSRDTDEYTLAKTQTEQLRMSGLLLEDPEAVLGMEHDGRGVFIPAKLVKVTDENGERWELDKKAKVASLENMGRIHRHINRLVRDMAGALHEGSIDAIPVEGSEYAPCDYCEFAHICGHESGDEVIEVAGIPPEEIFARMEAAHSGTKLDT
ncbi:MAG: PD-(D/E)XK nuclease family protein [Acetanaerobacterium sp.]